MDFSTLTSGERVKYLRTIKLCISQEDFGNKLGITKASISRIEKDIATLTERNIKSICREFNVSIAWIKEGLGDIFINLPETLLDELTDEYNLSSVDKKIVKFFLELNKEERDVFTNVLKQMLLEREK